MHPPLFALPGYTLAQKTVLCLAGFAALSGALHEVVPCKYVATRTYMSERALQVSLVLHCGRRLLHLVASAFSGPRESIMAAFSESAPVFKTRCAQVGLDAKDVEALEKVGVNSLAKVAFMTSYTPGSGDDKDLIAAFESALGSPPSVGQKSSFRRLFHESYAVTTSEMKLLVERTDQSVPRKLSVPERSERFEVVSKRLVGLSIRNRLEPADSLVDSFVSQYEQDKLQFVPWEKLVSKEQEASTGAKREPFFSLDSSGKLRSETKVEVRADTSTELLLQLALQRRGIAMEMANILDYHVHYHWVERLLSARLDSHPATHLQPTLDQCQQADRKLWQLLGESTRSGIQLKAGGRPLDGIFEKTWQSPEVLHLLQPMPRAAGSSASNQVPPPPKFHGAGPYERPSKGPRKGNGKGGKGGKGGGKVPSALSGCRSCTNAGENICFGYGLKTCRETVTRGRCVRGLHICAWPRCGKSHPALDCPMRSEALGQKQE